MPTWTELQEYTRGKYKLEDDRQDMLSMVWEYPDGRTQKILIRRYKAFDRQMIEFKSPFARVGEVDAAELLAKNSELPLATIARSGDVFIAVYNMLLEHLHMDDFELVLERVAAVADALEETYAEKDEF